MYVYIRNYVVIAYTEIINVLLNVVAYLILITDMFRGWMRDKAYQLLSGLHESGISLMWDDNMNRQELRRSGILKSCAKTNGNKNDHCRAESYKSLSFHSPFKILLWWHLSLCVSAWFFFFGEIRYPWLTSRRRNASMIF